MQREYLEFIIKDLPENSVKRACYIVREYLRYSEIAKMNEDSVLKSKKGCAVTLEEYIEASKILLANSYENANDDTFVEQFYCESDCSHNNGCMGFCRGEFSISKSSKTLCKHYADSQYI